MTTTPEQAAKELFRIVGEGLTNSEKDQLVLAHQLMDCPTYDEGRGCCLHLILGT